MSGRRIGRRALHGALVLVAALAAFLTAVSGASAFIVRGSAEQVDVTRLAANAEASLLGPGGTDDHACHARSSRTRSHRTSDVMPDEMAEQETVL